MSFSLAMARIIARIIAAAICLLLAVLAVGNRPNLAALTADERRQFMALGIAVIGLLMLASPPYSHSGRILFGAVLSILGTVAFYVINYQLSGRWPGGWVMPLLFLPGVLQLCCQVLTQQNTVTPHSGSRP